MTIEEMKSIKDSRGYSFVQLSDYTGVPVITLQRIFAGTTKNPRKATLDAIEKVLKGDESVYSGRAYSYEKNSSVKCSEKDERSHVFLENERSSMQSDNNRGSMLCEDEPVYGSTNRSERHEKKNGEYTIDDYYALPEDQWVELIDGYFYEMNAPRPVHQIISSLIFRTIIFFIEKNKGNCIPMYSPIDVQLDCDDRTMVQPDIVIVCDRDKIKDNVIFGAPDFVLEILSPSTRRKDMFIKSEKYCNAGVKEYWMVDPKKKVLIVYDFLDEDVTPVIVPLKGEYALSLYDGKLKINLDELSEAIEQFG